MAKSLVVFGPAGLATPTLELYTGDTLADAVTLTERTNAVGVYDGDTTAAPGTYDAVLKTGTTAVGAYGYALVGPDPSVNKVGDVVGVPDAPKYGEAMTRTHGTSGDTLPETITKN